MNLSRLQILFILLFTPLIELFGQVPNIFESPSVLKDFLDEKTYNVPEYGTIRFDLNTSETNRMRELREKDGADDEVVDFIFDITVKRNQSRRREKSGYKIEIRLDLRDPENSEIEPTGAYLNTFMLNRNIIYPIKGFPANYYLFADGDLYFSKVTWKKILFTDFKTIMTTSRKGPPDFYKNSDLIKDYATTTMIKCIPVPNQKKNVDKPVLSAPSEIIKNESPKSNTNIGIKSYCYTLSTSMFKIILIEESKKVIYNLYNNGQLEKTIQGTYIIRDEGIYGPVYMLTINWTGLNTDLPELKFTCQYNGYGQLQGIIDSQNRNWGLCN